MIKEVIQSTCYKIYQALKNKLKEIDVDGTEWGENSVMIYFCMESVILFVFLYYMIKPSFFFSCNEDLFKIWNWEPCKARCSPASFMLCKFQE